MKTANYLVERGTIHKIKMKKREWQMLKKLWEVQSGQKKNKSENDW